MNTFEAIARGEANRGKPEMVFDWNKAARLIVENRPKLARAGLRSDWEYTGGTIYEDGQGLVLDSNTFLASTWAVPELELDGVLMDCYIMEADMPKEWGEVGSDVKWPESSLLILRGSN